MYVPGIKNIFLPPCKYSEDKQHVPIETIEKNKMFKIDGYAKTIFVQ